MDKHLRGSLSLRCMYIVSQGDPGGFSSGGCLLDDAPLTGFLFFLVCCFPPPNAKCWWDMSMWASGVTPGGLRAMLLPSYSTGSTQVVCSFVCLKYKLSIGFLHRIELDKTSCGFDPWVGKIPWRRYLSLGKPLFSYLQNHRWILCLCSSSVTEWRAQHWATSVFHQTCS